MDSYSTELERRVSRLYDSLNVTRDGNDERRVGLSAKDASVRHASCNCVSF